MDEHNMNINRLLEKPTEPRSKIVVADQLGVRYVSRRSIGRMPHGAKMDRGENRP